MNNVLKVSYFYRALLCVPLGLMLQTTSVAQQGLRVSTSLSLPKAMPANVQQKADFIVAIVNSEPVTNNEVRARVLQLEQQIISQGGSVPARGQMLKDVLERLINERTQVQVAKDYGLKIEESALDLAVQNVARQNQMSMTQLQVRMKQDGMDYAAWRKSLRDEMTLTRVREREVESRVRISDNELEEFVREKGGESSRDQQLNLGHILIVVPETANATQIREIEQRALRVHRLATSGTDFAELAKEHSEGAERNAGGAMGIRPTDRYPQLFIDAVAGLTKGAVANLQKSGAGFHILKVLDKQSAGLASMTLTQTRARHILLRIGAQMTESSAIARLKQLKQEAVSGKDFAALAKEHSQDGSAREGGDLGWTNPGQFVPEFEEVMNGLAIGQISEPLVSRFGVHLIQVSERRSRNLSDKEQRDAARNVLREKKLDEAYVAWAQEVRSRAYVEMRETPQ